MDQRNADEIVHAWLLFDHACTIFIGNRFRPPLGKREAGDLVPAFIAFKAFQAFHVMHIGTLPVHYIEPVLNVCFPVIVMH